jgi:hypothetical protein
MPPAPATVATVETGGNRTLVVAAVVQPSRERSERTEMLMDIAAGIPPHVPESMLGVEHFGDSVEAFGTGFATLADAARAAADAAAFDAAAAADVATFGSDEPDIGLMELAERASSGMHVSPAAIRELGAALLKLRSHFGDHNIIGVCGERARTAAPAELPAIGERL